jgi:RHS repeat-associated protein
VRNTRTLDYGYDSVGNRKWTKRDGDKGDSFLYDYSDQVTALRLDVTNPETPPIRQTIFYDANGNRTSFALTLNGPTDTYSINNLNQYSGRNNINADYDPKGNFTQGFDASAYTFDAQNRLLTAPGMSFKYDGLNRQVSRAANGVTTYSVWDGWNLVQEYHMSGNNVVVEDASYLSGVTGLVKNLKTNNYYYQDGSGSTSHLANSSGTLLEWYRYDLQGTPFFYDANNNQRNPNQSAYGVCHLFTGQQWYKEIGLYDLRNRFYSPDIGRFLQPDPAGFSGDATNLYRYCENNPVTYGDPSGEKAIYKAAGGYWYYVVNPGWENLTGTSIGPHGWCAEGAQILAGGYWNGTYHDMPNTSYWRQGAPLSSGTATGTVVARGWVNGRYPQVTARYRVPSLGRVIFTAALIPLRPLVLALPVRVKIMQMGCHNCVKEQMKPNRQYYNRPITRVGTGILACFISLSVHAAEYCLGPGKKDGTQAETVVCCATPTGWEGWKDDPPYRDRIKQLDPYSKGFLQRFVSFHQPDCKQGPECSSLSLDTKSRDSQGQPDVEAGLRDFLEESEQPQDLRSSVPPCVVVSRFGSFHTENSGDLLIWRVRCPSGSEHFVNLLAQRDVLVTIDLRAPNIKDIVPKLDSLKELAKSVRILDARLALPDIVEINIDHLSDKAIKQQLLQLTPVGTPMEKVYDLLQLRLAESPGFGKVEQGLHWDKGDLGCN